MRREEEVRQYLDMLKIQCQQEDDEAKAYMVGQLHTLLWLLEPGYTHILADLEAEQIWCRSRPTW